TSHILSSPVLHFFSILRLPPISTLFPYTTLFRSRSSRVVSMAAPSPVSSMAARCCSATRAGRAKEGEHGLSRADELVVAGEGCRSEEHTSELQSPDHLVCRLLLEKKKKQKTTMYK